MREPSSSTAELKRLGEALNEQRGRLRKELEGTLRAQRGTEIPATREGVFDTKDTAQRYQWSEEGAANVARLRLDLAAVEEALGRLAHGTFGQCVDCGEPIEAARLRSQPSAGRCRTCQERHERRLAGGPGGASVPGDAHRG